MPPARPTIRSSRRERQRDRQGRGDGLRGSLDALAEVPTLIVLEGDAGIGKTTLWLAALDEARARLLTVLDARPAESEASYSFAGVGDLLDIELDRILVDLPVPHAQALRLALLLEAPTAGPPEQHAVGIALLGAFRVLARSGPVLVAVDDAQ